MKKIDNTIIGHIHEVLDISGMRPGDTILVACSGGADSMCLLHAMTKLSARWNVNILACHLDHSVRGEESEKDARMVASFCSSHDVPLISDKLQEREVRAAAARMGSLEAAMRKYRYHFFGQAAQNLGARFVFTAHHAQDQEETVLFRASRHMNWRSLAGIPPVRGIYMRPLLGVSRELIVKYCRDHGIQFTKDSTNRDLDHARNMIRHVTVPGLRASFHPAIRDLLNRTGVAATRLAEVEKRLLSTLGINPGKGKSEIPQLPLEILETLGGEVRKGALLRLISLAARDYPKDPILGSLSTMIANGTTGDVRLNARTIARIGGGFIKILRDEALLPIWGGTYDVSEIPGEVTIGDTGMIFGVGVSNVDDTNPPEDQLAVLACEGKLILPLKVRQRREGDTFRPLGMQGTTRLAKFLIDRKIPRHVRDFLPLVEDGNGDIIWIAGVEISEKVRLVNNSSEVRLSISGNGPYLRQLMTEKQ